MPYRASLLLVAALLAGCHGLENVGVFGATPGSPPPKQSSFGDPVVVTSDNPWLGGAFPWYAGEGSSASGVFATDGAWTGLADAAVVLHEYKRTGAPVATLQARLLPRPGEHLGPGLGMWATRGGKLIHDNVFTAVQTHTHTATGISHESNHALTFALSPDVALVPVVLIAWRTGDETQEYLDRLLAIGRALLDFEPTVPLGAPLPGAASLAFPDEFNTPPDDIWSQCDIQFQVVAEAVLDTPQPWPGPNTCKEDSSFSVFADEVWRDTRLREVLGDAQMDQLEALFPFYVGYGAYQCPGFVAKTPKSLYVEISSVTGDKYDNVTAHEIGHLFFGSGHQYPPGNLMANGALGGTHLTPEQCQKARSKALEASARYAEYNQRIGRAALPRLVAAPPEKAVVPGDVCCQVENVAGSLPAPLCAALKGHVVPKSACEPPKACCVVGLDPPEASQVLASECTDDSLLLEDQCDSVCCDVAGEVLKGITRYACEQGGNTAVPCPKRVK